ncbi:MAG: hypothetical protein AB7L13_17930 [Acidimicrobiia bacterium]
MRLRSPARRRGFALIALIAALAAALVVSAPRRAVAATDPPVTVKLTIVEINDDGNDDDSLSDADFYVKGSFTDGTTTKSFNNEGDRIEGEQNIRPNWSFQYDAQSAAGSATIDLHVLDYDSGFNGGDDETISAKLDVKFKPCTVTGDGVNVGCGWEAAVSQSDTVRLRVEVFLPPSSPGLRIRCLQNPLLPQPGQAVTITAQTLDGKAAVAKIVDTITIDVNNTTVQTATGVSQTTYVFTPNESRFRMRCYANNDDSGTKEAADTWARDVRVGTVNELASPIANLGSTARNIDIVAMPDSDTYTTWNDPNYLNDLYSQLWNGFYGNEFTLSHQNQLNIWVAQRMADTDGTMGTCDSLTPPEDWDRFSFADSGWIVHSDQHRDCARRSERVFGAWTGDATIAVHETGHSPFGLADEYCCDGGYFQADPLPNVYDGLNACIDDTPNIGALSSDCRLIKDNWYTSDPASGDVMVDDQRTFNKLDTRRWLWLLNRCANDPEGC